MQRGHVSLYQAGRRDKAPRPRELDGGEINADYPQPVTGELLSGRYPGPAAQVQDGGAGGQETGQLRDPSGVAADVFSRRAGSRTVIAPVSDGSRVVAAADELALPGPLCHVVGLHSWHPAWPAPAGPHLKAPDPWWLSGGRYARGGWRVWDASASRACSRSRISSGV